MELGAPRVHVYRLPPIGAAAVGNVVIDRFSLSDQFPYSHPSFLVSLFRPLVLGVCRLCVVSGESEATAGLVRSGVEHHGTLALAGGASIGVDDTLSKVVDEAIRVAFHSTTLSTRRASGVARPRGEPAPLTPGRAGSAKAGVCKFIAPTTPEVSREGADLPPRIWARLTESMRVSPRLRMLRLARPVRGMVC